MRVTIGLLIESKDLVGALNKLNDNPKIITADIVTGGGVYNALVDVKVKDPTELAEILTEEIYLLEGFTHANPMIRVALRHKPVENLDLTESPASEDAPGTQASGKEVEESNETTASEKEIEDSTENSIPKHTGVRQDRIPRRMGQPKKTTDT